jgi:hypothetical protein
VLDKAESKLSVPKLSLSNQINIAGIFAKNQHISPLVHEVIENFRQLPLNALLRNRVEEAYGQFDFKQCALLVNCLRAAQISDPVLLKKLEDFMLVKMNKLEKA